MSDNTTSTADDQRWHDVTVHWPDGTSHDDGIRGADRAEALANAEFNWISGNPYGSAERIEYRGQSEQVQAEIEAAYAERDAQRANQDGWAR